MKSVREIIDSIDCDELCKYCAYSSDCNGSVKCGPNGPIFPPCSDGLDEDDFDLESYLADLEDEDET